MSMSTSIFVAFVGVGFAIILNEMENGAKFDNCIAIADWEGKTLTDDIMLTDRNVSTGCCPAGTVPGAKFYIDRSGTGVPYISAQIVCGFNQTELQGTVEYWTMPDERRSREMGLEYRNLCDMQCYLWKQNLPCKDGGTQRLNGCCAAKDSCETNAGLVWNKTQAVWNKTATGCGFKEGCKNLLLDGVETWGGPANKTLPNYCGTFQEMTAMEYMYNPMNVTDPSTFLPDDLANTNAMGTPNASDDLADDKLQISKVMVVKGCGGGETGSGGSPVPVPVPVPVPSPAPGNPVPSPAPGSPTPSPVPSSATLAASNNGVVNGAPGRSLSVAGLLLLFYIGR